MTAQAPQPRARVLGLACLRCDTLYHDPLIFTGCPRCAEQKIAVNLTVRLDLTPLRGVSAESFPNAPRDLWRFRALLPIETERPVSLGEGATPLIHLERLGKRFGLPRLFAKDESQNPTWSYKDRLCSVAVTHAVASGARVVTVSSSGNHGASTAAYAARAGLPCVVFTVASAPETMKMQMQAYGAIVVVCATGEARWTLMRQGIERYGWYPTGGFLAPPVGSNPHGIEGYKTLAYEVAEDLDWAAPDLCVVPSSYSDGLYGMWKGWLELEALGLVKTRPRMVAAEPFGPLAHAIERGLEVPEIVDGGSTVAFSIASRYGTYQGLTALKQSGGMGVRLTDEGVLEAQRVLARDEGLFMEPASAAALSAVLQLASRRALDPAQTIVIVLTSSGLKDPAASGAWLPPVLEAGDDLSGVLTVLRNDYGLALDR